MSALSARFADIGEMASRRSEWRRLSEAALDPNPFYGPDLLVPSIQNRASDVETKLLIVERSRKLCGLFPLQRPFLHDGAMGLGWMMHRDPLTCLTMPLIHPEEPATTLSAALEALAKADGPPALVLPMLTENRPFAAILKREAEQSGRKVAVLDNWERPAIARGSILSRKLSPGIEKKRRLLEREGPLRVLRMMSGNPEIAGFLEAFLAMEAKSWKGQQGTAIQSVPALEAVVRNLASASTTSPTLLIEVLASGEVPVAINLNFTAAGTVYTVKSTYDPDFSRFSPGRLLDAMAFHLVEEHDGAFLHVDSCAGPGHPLESLWPDREDLVCLGVALKPLGRFNLAALSLGRSLSNHVRRWRYRETYTTRKTKRAA